MAAHPTSSWSGAASRYVTVLGRVLYRHIAELTWPAIGVIALVHYTTSWALMSLTEADDIAAPSVYWYFYIVTSTTVGYGDLSPATTFGRLVAVFWVMPGGIALFTSVIAKVVQSASGYWRRRMRGLGDYRDLMNHTLILGWAGDATRRMVSYMRGDSRDREIVLVADQAMENPMPDQVHFVRGQTMTHAEVLDRAGIVTAGRAIILGRDDNETLAAGLAVAARNPNLHIAAFFHDEVVADLLKSHCPRAECLLPMSIELLVRTADDPGSSRVPKTMLSTLVDPTLYSMPVPESCNDLRFGAVFRSMKERHHATVLGVAEDRTNESLALNPPDDRVVKGGHTIYYIAARRLDPASLDWASMQKESGG
ncbi:MAG: NAD-binding protein [Alphaproteobacteria bacterium]|nr:NAD-binding protein [Alphaproteobacteria bacterium]MCB9931281.1 NAD-binding protein [Alphaproteobacteria bacterium]